MRCSQEDTTLLHLPVSKEQKMVSGVQVWHFWSPDSIWTCSMPCCLYQQHTLYLALHFMVQRQS